MQHGKGGDISIYGGTHPYGQGGNGLGGMFRSLFRSATPFLKTTAKMVGKGMLDTGLETRMQLVQDVINGQPLKKAAKTRAKAAGKNLLTGVIDDITQQGGGKRVYKRADTSKPRSEGQTRKGEHLVQRSKLFLIKDDISTPSLSPWCKLKFTVV